MRLLLIIIASLLAATAGCGGATTDVDSGASTTDSGASDGATATDSGGELDAASGTDGGGDDDGGDATDAGDDGADASSGDDAGTTAACAPGSAVPDREAGVCDGRGRIACTTWAQMHGGPDAVAQCTPPAGRCARASECDARGCTCGTQPECADDQMCVRDAGGAFACVCIDP
jgi:hypothetical protein